MRFKNYLRISRGKTPGTLGKKVMESGNREYPFPMGIPVGDGTLVSAPSKSHSHKNLIDSFFLTSLLTSVSSHFFFVSRLTVPGKAKKGKIKNERKWLTGIEKVNPFRVKTYVTTFLSIWDQTKLRSLSHSLPHSRFKKRTIFSSH